MGCETYILTVTLDRAKKSINGLSQIVFKQTKSSRDSFQIDLQDGLIIDSVWLYKTSWTCKGADNRGTHNGEFTKPVRFFKEGNVWWVINECKEPDTSVNAFLNIWYHGTPRTAVNPPWDGGFIWMKDSVGKPWIAVACQALGASSWWPCKDYQGDEPDDGISIRINYIEKYKAVSNGKAPALDTLSTTLIQQRKRKSGGQSLLKNMIGTSATPSTPTMSPST